MMFIKKIFYLIPLVALVVGSVEGDSLSKITPSNTSPAKGWISAYTNIKNSAPRWEITNSKSDSISQYTFHLLKTDAHGSEFNLCYTNKIHFLNGTITVEFKADSGHEDQGGGIVYRVKDNNNYYVARYNPLENNLCFYYVKNSYRRLLMQERVILKDKQWHTMKIAQHGNHYAIYLDSKKILQGDNTIFPNAGGIGIWTKADALTSFKDLKVTKED